ncbi:MAG: hypothetical protein IT198_14850 [Acidimicrobiia bacterium]|nr:hypothetical protein [Acidimicrobiia bacterium]
MKRSCDAKARIVTLLLAVLGACALGFLDSGPARADGLDVLCGAFDPVDVPEDNPTNVAGAKFTLDAEGPDGSKKHLDQAIGPFGIIPDLATGGPNFSNVMREVNIDADPAIDASFGWGFRLSTARGVGSMQYFNPNPIDALFNDNFQLPDDYSGKPYVSGAGLDLYFKLSPESAATQHKVEFGGVVDLINRDGSRTHLKVRVGLDGRPGHSPGTDPRLPRLANISLLFGKKDDPTTPDNRLNTGYMGLGVRFLYEGVETDDNPPLGLTVAAEIVDDAGQPVEDSDFLDLSLGLSHAPGDLAVGLRQRCGEDRSISMSHLSFNRANANPATNVDIDLHSLAGSGLPTVPGGPAGDAVAVDGLIAGLPQLVDVIMQPTEIGVTMSPDIESALTLDGLLFAPDDPDSQTENRLFVSGAVEGLPQHIRFSDTVSFLGTRVLRAWGSDLVCGTPPAGGADEALPIYPPDCAVGTEAPVKNLRFVVQNFAPGDAAAMAAVTEFITEPVGCPDEQGLELGYRQDVRSESGGLWRASGCVKEVLEVGVEMPRNPTYRPRITPWMRRQGPSDIDASVGAVIRNGDDRLVVELVGHVNAAPADLDISFQATEYTTTVPIGGRIETGSRNIFDLRIPPGLNVDFKRIHVASGPLAETPRTLVFGTGSVSALPPHLRVETQTITSPAGVRLETAVAETCPTRPYGDPFVPSGNICNAYGLPEAQQAVGDIDFEVQNFAPGDPAGAEVLGLFPTVTEAAFAGNWATIAYRSPRDDRPVGHFSTDIKVAGLRRAAFDLSGTGDPAEVLSTRTKVKAGIELAAPLPRLLVKAQIDGRTSATDASASGFLARASGVLSPLPENLSLEFESRDYVLALFEDTPFALTWGASSPISVTWPYASLGRPGPENVFVQGPAPDLLTISGNVEIGNADGSGGLATDGHVAMTETHDVAANWDREITYSASAPTVVRAGVVISTAADRAPAGTANDLRTRVRAEVELPAVPSSDPLRVSWSEVGNAVREIDAFLCAENEGCPDNKVTATFHRGKTRTDDVRTDLAPVVPGPQSMGGLLPVFTEFNAGPDGFAEGMRAVLRTDGTSAGKLAVRDIASVSAVLDSTATVRVRSDRTPILDCRPNPGGWPPIICTVMPDPFTVNVFAQPTSSALPVFVDGTLNDLPEDIVAQFRADGGEYSDEEPWIWLNTESVEIESPPDLSEVGGETGGPQFDGMVLVGSQTRIVPTAADRFTATESPGVKARASIVTSISGATTLGFGANVRLRLPRHVEIWKPMLRSCGAGTSTLSTCAAREAYEAEVRTRADVKVRTTADSLGFLKGRFEIDNGDTDYQGNMSLETIPGSLDARVQLVQNKRLPWTTVDLAYTSNISPGDATLTVYDRCLPAYKGDVANSPALAQRILPGQCITSPPATNKVANYDITLRDIPAELDFTARIAASESPVLGTPREHIACPDSGYAGRGPTRLGYIHADLGFGEHDDDRDDDGRFDIDVDVRTGRTGHDGDPETSTSDTENSQAMATLSAEGELSGDIRAKVLNLGNEQKTTKDAIFPDNVSFRSCIDFDLPIALDLEDVRDLRLSMSGAKLGIFGNESGRVAGEIGESFRCRSLTAPLGCNFLQFNRTITRSGAPYARLDVSLTIGSYPPIVESGRKWKGMGLIDVTHYAPSSFCPLLCHYVTAPANEFDTDTMTSGDGGTIRRPDGSFAEGMGWVMLMDALWGTATRTSGILGLAELYDAMNNTFALDMPATIPTLDAGVARESMDGFFAVAGGFTTEDADARAVGSDGTRYMVYYRLVSPGGDGGMGASWQPELWALHPGANREEEFVRWIRPVGWHVGSSIIGRGSHDVSVSPNADGSVSVSLDFSGTAEDNAARFDASGNGRVLTGTLTVPTTAVTGDVNQVLVLALPPGSELQYRPVGTRRWYLGDGRVTGNIVNGGTIVRYTTPGTYYVLGIDYDSKGREVAQHAFVVEVGGGVGEM